MNCKNTREADVISIEPWWSRTSAQQLCTVVAERIIKYNLVSCVSAAEALRPKC